MLKKGMIICAALALLVVGCLVWNTVSTKSSTGDMKEYNLSIGDDEVETFLVSFDTDGGKEIFDIEVDDGAVIVLPTCTKNGFSFVAWVDDNNAEYEAGDEYTVTGDVTLKAKWLVSDTVLYGDVNGDGNVNKLDRAFFARYLAGWPEYPADVIDMAAADVNDDGKVNKLDRAILTRHLAGWPGYGELPYVE